MRILKHNHDTSSPLTQLVTHTCVVRRISRCLVFESNDEGATGSDSAAMLALLCALYECPVVFCPSVVAERISAGGYTCGGRLRQRVVKGYV